jgi:hypothetical protein
VGDGTAGPPKQGIINSRQIFVHVHLIAEMRVSNILFTVVTTCAEAE